MRDIVRPGIFVKDLDQFTQFIIHERCLIPKSPVVQFGLDVGQNMLKMLEIVKSMEPEDDLEVKRAKYSDGVCPVSN